MDKQGLGYGWESVDEQNREYGPGGLYEVGVKVWMSWNEGMEGKVWMSRGEEV